MHRAFTLHAPLLYTLVFHALIAILGDIYQPLLPPQYSQITRYHSSLVGNSGSSCSTCASLPQKGHGFSSSVITAPPQQDISVCPCAGNSTLLRPRRSCQTPSQTRMDILNTAHNILVCHAGLLQSSRRKDTALVSQSFSVSMLSMRIKSASTLSSSSSAYSEHPSHCIISSSSRNSAQSNNISNISGA